MGNTLSPSDRRYFAAFRAIQAVYNLYYHVNYLTISAACKNTCYRWMLNTRPKFAIFPIFSMDKAQREALIHRYLHRGNGYAHRYMSGTVLFVMNPGVTSLCWL